MKAIMTYNKLTLHELELLDTATAYNGAQHREICGRAALEIIEYKKIEEKFGIDLITLFKAFKNGCYGIQNGKIYKMNIVRLDNQDKESIILFRNKHYGGECYLLKDYGKTWALTKGELL